MSPSSPTLHKKPFHFWNGFFVNHIFSPSKFKSKFLLIKNLRILLYLKIDSRKFIVLVIVLWI